MSSETFLVLFILGVVAALIAIGVVVRRRAIARRAALRASEVVSIPYVSPARSALFIVPCIFGFPALAAVPIIALDQSRSHALLLVCSIVALSAVGIGVGVWLTNRFAVTGKLAIDARSLVLERSGKRVAIALGTPFRLREAVILPDKYGNAGVVETVVEVEQADTIVFRYPNVIGETPLAVPGAVAPPFTGDRFGIEARVVHERLRNVVERALA